MRRNGTAAKGRGPCFPSVRRFCRYHLEGGIFLSRPGSAPWRNCRAKDTPHCWKMPTIRWGSEYLKALRRMDSPSGRLPIHPVRRGTVSVAAGWDIASASYLRELLAAGRPGERRPPPLPIRWKSFMKLAQAGRCPADQADWRAMLAALRRLTKEQIVRLPGVSEGLENRLYRRDPAGGWRTADRRKKPNGTL